MVAKPQVVFLPIKTTNPLNGQQGNYHAVARKRKLHRHTAKALCPKHPLPVVVTMIRLTSGRGMDGDGLQASLKSTRDGIADKLGTDDADPRITWLYDQAKCKRGEYGVRVELKPPTHP